MAPAVTVPSPSTRSFDAVIREDWPRILLSSFVVILVFGGVDVLAKMRPESPWMGLVAGIPMGLLSAYFVAGADMSAFLQHYSQTSLCLTITTVSFATVVASQGTQNVHDYIPAFVLLWLVLNATFIL